MTDEPRSLTSLQARIRNEARRAGRAANTVERLVANVVVGQMLPEGVMKGGAGPHVDAYCDRYIPRAPRSGRPG